VELGNALKPHLARNASVVTIGISSLLVTPDNYGYMGPIKAALESSSRFLAKSFSADSDVRFNVVGAGPLKTSASAGIPGYWRATFTPRN
jgi:enoyl-[acyl-carrier protein] reductase I